MKVAQIVGGLLVFCSLCSQAEQWNSYNDPNNFNTNWHPVQYETRFSLLPSSGAVPLKETPWSDSYWPKNRGSFAYRWQAFQKTGKSPDLKPEALRDMFFGIYFYNKREVAEMSESELNELSPLEKYSIFKGDFKYKMARKYLDPNNAWASYWEGYCHAWAAASAQFPEPLPVTVPVEVRGRTIMLSFGSGDIKALLVASYAERNWKAGARRSNLNLTSLGQICTNEQQFLFPTSKIKHGVEVMSDYSDTNGLLDSDLEKSVQDYQARLNRVTGAPIDPSLPKRARAAAETDACRDVNAGALHIVMANQLGLMHEGFLLDKTRDYEVWNQPAFKFTSKAVATEAPSRTSAPGTQSVVVVESKLYYADDTNYGWTYWNPTLAGIFGLKDLHEHFLKEYSKYQSVLIEEGDLRTPQAYPEHVFGSADYKYRLDLDEEGRIIGGDWITLNRPDDLYLVGKIGFEGEFAELSQLYHPMLPRE